MVAATAIAIFIIPALFYLVEKLSGVKDVAHLPAAAPEAGAAGSGGDD